MKFDGIFIRRHSQAKPWHYADLDKFQNKMGERIRSGDQGSCLILSEVAPVVTLGRRAQTQNDLHFSENEYQSRGIDIYRCERGGLATYHGPGQWVLFPVGKLESLTGHTRGVRLLVMALLEAALETAKNFGAQAEIRMGQQVGVWTEKGKLASLGIQIHEGMVFHGIAMNFFKTPESFWGVNPCGLKGCAVDDLGLTENEFPDAGQKFCFNVIERLENL